MYRLLSPDLIFTNLPAHSCKLRWSVFREDWNVLISLLLLVHFHCSIYPAICLVDTDLSWTPAVWFFLLATISRSRSISHNNGDGLLCTAQTLKCNWISHKRRTAVFTSYTQNSILPGIYLRSTCLKPLRCVVLTDYPAHKVHRDKIMVSKKVTSHANLSSLP